MVGPANGVFGWQIIVHQIGSSVVKTDFSGKGPHFSAKHKIFLLTVKDVERALFARIQLGRSRARFFFFATLPWPSTCILRLTTHRNRVTAS